MAVLQTRRRSCFWRSTAPCSSPDSPSLSRRFHSGAPPLRRIFKARRGLLRHRLRWRWSWTAVSCSSRSSRTRCLRTRWSSRFSQSQTRARRSEGPALRSIWRCGPIHTSASRRLASESTREPRWHPAVISCASALATRCRTGPALSSTTSGFRISRKNHS